MCVGSHDAWLCQMGFHRATSIEVSTREANGVGISAIKASRRSQCPLMPPLKVHHYRGEPRGRDCTYNYKNHSTAWHGQFFLKQLPVGRFSGVMAHGPAQKLSPHGKTITNLKGTSRRQRARNVDLKSCAFYCCSYLLRFRPLPRPRRHRGAVSNVSRQKAAFVHNDGGPSLRWWIGAMWAWPVRKSHKTQPSTTDKS